MYRQMSSDLKESRSACYCCRSSTSQSDINELDMALNELGMLSCVTNSRTEYIRELKRSNPPRKYYKSESDDIGSPNGYKIIQIDTNYVTGMSSERLHRKHSSPTILTNGMCNGYNFNESEPIGSNMRFNYRNQTDSFEEEARRNRLSRIRLARQRRLRKPYNVPGRLYHSMQESDIPQDMDKDNTSPKHISKSNSSSPNKLTTGPLVRSRSLDNLDLTRLKLSGLSQDSADDRRSIEQVSLDLNKLQVS